MSTETSQTRKLGGRGGGRKRERAREKREKQNFPKDKKRKTKQKNPQHRYPITMGQLEKMECTHNVHYAIRRRKKKQNRRNT